MTICITPTLRCIATTFTLCATALAATTHAQDYEICSGPDAPALWIGGSDAASDISASEAPLDTTSQVPSGNHSKHLLFTTSAITSVRLEAHSQGTGDPEIQLWDAEGTLLASDDDGGDNYESREEIELQPGRYCLSVASVDSEQMSVQMRVGRLEHAALSSDESMNASSDGLATCLPETEALDLSPSNIEDWAEGASNTASLGTGLYYRFTLDNPEALTITANGESADPVLTLFSSAGVSLAENDDYGSTYNSRLDMTTPLAAGTYCLGLRAISDGGIPVEVTVKRYDPEEAIRQQYDSAEAAPPLNSDYPVSTLEFSGNTARAETVLNDKATWYRVDIMQPSVLLVEGLSGGSGDPTVSIFDDLGRLIAFNDDALPDSYDSLAAVKVASGSYLIAIKLLDSSEIHAGRLLVEQYPAGENETESGGFWNSLFK